MSRTPEYPPVDPRRLSRLRQVLLKDIAALAPDWRGAQEALGPDRAIVEIAARLSEESTRRLDKTPERDALAFLDLFDIAPPRPGAATGVSVFTLKEEKTVPVLAPARTGIDIETRAGEAASFETVNNLRIQPARISLLATVDPAADRLELAPAQVTSHEPDLTPRPEYQLAASAGPEATVISIVPPVGILTDDLLRVKIQGSDVPVFLEVAEFSEDGLATLKAPVVDSGLSVDQVVKIERMTRLDAFAMPNRQEHGFYIGDNDVLNVKEPATFTLCFEPSSIPGVLSPNAVIFEIWGTRETHGTPEETARWHRLVPLASTGSELRLYKAWTGPVEEFELNEIRKSRCIRIRPLAAIMPGEDGGHPLTGGNARIDRVVIGIKTEEPRDTGGDTVSQAAYNGTPLPLTSSFFPFGAEPRRFDTFALAAPEAFTKPDSTVTLNFQLMDATLAVMTASFRLDDERHAYGVGKNGRLQVIDLTSDEKHWCEIQGPAEEEGADVTLELDSGAGIVACGNSEISAGAVTAQDIVIARTGSGGFYSALVDINKDARAYTSSIGEVAEWSALPNLPEGALDEDEQPALVAIPVPVSNPVGNYAVFLLEAGSGGMHRITVSTDGQPAADSWLATGAVGAAPVLPANPVLSFVDGSVDHALGFVDQSGAFLTVDETGVLWLLQMRLNGSTAQWYQLQKDDGAPVWLTTDTRPAAMWTSDKLLVAGLASGESAVHLWEFGTAAGFHFQADHGTGPDIAPGVTLRMVQGLGNGAGSLPHVLGYQNRPGTGQVFEWAPHTGQISTHQPGQGMALSDPPVMSSAGIFLPDDKDGRALVVFGADEQVLVLLRINPSAVIDEQADWLPVPQLPETGLPDAEDYGLIMVERFSTVHGERTIEVFSVFDTTSAGTDIIRLPANTTDWDVPVRVYREKSTTTEADYDPDLPSGDANYGTLVGTPGSVSGLQTGQLLVIRSKDVLDGYGVFSVASTIGDDTLVVTEPDDLDTLMGGLGTAIWQEVHEVAVVNAGTSYQFEGTLVHLDPDTAEPDGLTLFENSGTVLAAVELASSGHILLAGWGGSTPAVGEIVKLVTAEASPEIFEVKSFSSGYTAPELSWEYFNGNGWKSLDRNFHDTTANFSHSGTVSFTVPSSLSPTEISGQEDYWIRARLVGGDYGKPVYKVDTSIPTEQKVVVDISNMHPPEVAGVTACFELEPQHVPELVIARNNQRDLDQSSANRLAGGTFAMFEGALAKPLGERGDRAIMLGMTRPLEPGPASLFVQVLERDGEAELIIETLGPENTWAPAPLSEHDPTSGLYRSGLLRFNVTERPAQVLLFGQTLYWLRICVKGSGDWAPRITGMWLNGVDIVQAETVRQELLGSSLGQPDLELTLLKPPILANSLELRVRERLSDEEIATLNAAAREGAPEPVKTDVPNLRGSWVLWKQVDSLQDQAGDSRVYLLSSDGGLRFGGRNVPAGRDNIRAFSYQSGGQRVETGAFADSRLRGSVEGIDLVLAPAPIGGGTAMPSRADLIARMTDALRNAGAGLSLSDLEDLVRDMDSEIVQARAFAPESPGGRVRLIVLARGESRTPEYSLAQRENLRRVLQMKMSDAWGPDCLEVCTAAFVEVRVTVNLVARPGRRAALETEAGERLGIFLHAALGGPEGAGWPPGRRLWPMDIRRVLSGLSSLDRVLNIEIAMPGGRGLDDVRPHEVITTTSTRDVTVLVQEEAVA